jgi:hypothetical protein
MTRSLLISCLLLTLATAASAQDSLVGTLTTDKEVYEYGEPIELRYTVINEGETEVTWTASHLGCAAGFVWDSLVPPGESCGCYTAVKKYVYAPESSWTWVWYISPPFHAVPETDGIHHIVAGKEIFRRHESVTQGHFTAGVTFRAPRFIGGMLSVRLADGITLDDVSDVIEVLDATVVSSIRWRIAAVTPREAVAMFSDDDRFKSMQMHRCIYGSEEYAVGIQPGGFSTETGLTAPFPNPASSQFSFELVPPSAGYVLIELLDLQGRRVARLHDGPMAGGQPVTVSVEAPRLAAGSYLVRTVGEGYVYVRTLTIVR